MSIDKIGRVNNFNNVSRVKPKNNIEKTTGADSVNISTEAMSMAESNRIMDIVRSAPDIRADKVAEAKAKLNDPNYLSDENMLRTVGERLSKVIEI